MSQTPNKFSKQPARYARIMACTYTGMYQRLYFNLVPVVVYLQQTNKKAFQSSAKFEHGKQGPVGGPCLVRVGMPGGWGHGGRSVINDIIGFLWADRQTQLKTLSSHNFVGGR